MKKNQGILFQDLTSMETFDSLILPPREAFVHWILRLDQLPSFLQTQDGLFRRHLDHRRGIVLPLTFSGISAPALFPGELSADIEATFRHPTAGFQQHFPEMRVPAVISQGAFLTSLSPGELPSLGDWLTLDEIHNRLVFSTGGRHYELPLSRPWEAGGRFYLVDGLTDWKNLPKNRQFIPLSQAGRLPLAGQQPCGLLPTEKQAFSQAWAIRQHLRAPEVLLPMAPDFFQPPAELPGSLHHLGGVKDRVLVASMHGTTDFREAGQVSHFQGGRFKGISDQQLPKIRTGGSQAFYQWEGKSYLFSTISAFSLEGEESWGLRESLLLEGEPFLTPGRLTIDYFFLNDSPEFCVSATLRHPRFRQPGLVTGYGVFEWLLMSWAPWETIHAEIVNHRGTPEKKELKRTRDPQIVQGAGFVFQKKNMSLGVSFPQNQVPGPRILPFRLGSLGGRTGLLINPEGAYGKLPSESLENWEEHFNFQVRLNASAPPGLELSDQGKREIIPPYTRKI